MDINDILPGTVVSRNRIEEKIGSGGSGVVYLAADLESKRKIALKFLNKEMLRDIYKSQLSSDLSAEEAKDKLNKQYKTITKRFKKEYENQLLGIHHPNIASVYEFGYFEGFFFFTTEFIEGKNIFLAGVRLSPDEKVSLFIQMFEGLQFIHDNGLLHGDIKPENVLVEKRNGKQVVKIIDFGIAAAISDSKRMIAGTPMFMSPEVILSWDEKNGVSSDLYSAAVLMYYCLLTGSYPFLDRHACKGNLEKLAEIVEKESPPQGLEEQSDRIPQYLDTIVMRLLSKKPQDRFYGSARAVINALKTRSPDDFKDDPEIKSPYLIPDKHIAHDAEIKNISANLDLLAKGKQPSPTSVYCFSGEENLGKTHLLQTIKKLAEEKAGKISVHSMKFPVDDEWAAAWINQLSNDLDENKLPLVILFDDLHLLEGSSNFAQIKKTILGLIRTIVEREIQPGLFKKQKPLFLCFTTHSGKLTSKENIVSIITETKNLPIQIINLKPFTEIDLKNYLKSTVALRVQEIPQRWIKSLLRQTGGVPGEINEHLIQQDSEGLLFDIDGSVHLFAAQAPEADETHKEVPKSTETRLLKLYNSLSPDEKRVVNFISTWYYKWLTPALKLTDFKELFSTPSLNQTLINLCRKKILVHSTSDEELTETDTLPPQISDENLDKGDIYSFANPYLPDLVYSKLDENKGEEWHSTIAAYISKKYSHDSQYLNAIQLHIGLGFSTKKSISNIIRLSRTLIFKTVHVDSAIELLENALKKNIAKNLISANEAIYIHLLLIHAHRYAGEYKKALTIFDETLNFFDAKYQTTWKLRFYLAALPAYIALHKYDEANQIITEAYKTASINKHQTYYLLFLNWEGLINFYRKDEGREYLDKAKAIFEQSLELEKTLPNVIVNRITNNELGQVYLALGEKDKAAKEMLTKLTRCESTGNTILIMLATLALAETLRNCRKFSRAVTYCQKAITLAKRTNLGHWLVKIHLVLSMCYLDWHKYKESIDQSHRCISASVCLDNENEHSEVLKYAWTNIGNCYNEMKNWNEAPKFFEAATDLGKDDFLQARARLGMAESLLHMNKLEESLSQIDEADAILAKLPNIREDLKFVSGYWRIKVLKKQQKYEEAISLLPCLKELAGNNSLFLRKYKEVEKRV
ncbi:MAG: protein kinase [Pseudomonadota bacterium]